MGFGLKAKASLANLPRVDHRASLPVPPPDRLSFTYLTSTELTNENAVKDLKTRSSSWQLGVKSNDLTPSTHRYSHQSQITNDQPASNKPSTRFHTLRSWIREPRKHWSSKVIDSTLTSAFHPSDSENKSSASMNLNRSRSRSRTLNPQDLAQIPSDHQPIRIVNPTHPSSRQTQSSEIHSHSAFEPHSHQRSPEHDFSKENPKLLHSLEPQPSLPVLGEFEDFDDDHSSFYTLDDRAELELDSNELYLPTWPVSLHVTTPPLD